MFPDSGNGNMLPTKKGKTNLFSFGCRRNPCYTGLYQHTSLVKLSSLSLLHTSTIPKKCTIIKHTTLHYVILILLIFIFTATNNTTVLWLTERKDIKMKSFLVGYTNCKRKIGINLTLLNPYADLKPHVPITFYL